MKHVHPMLMVLWFCLIVCCSINSATAQAMAQQQPVKPEAKDRPVNLLPNGSMEYWHPSGIRPQGWSAWTPDPLRHTWNIQRDLKNHRDGQSSMQVNVGQWANVFSGAKIEAGHTYTFSIWVYCDKPAKLTVTLNLGGNDLSGPEKTSKRAKSEYDITPGQWQRVSVTDTMPAGATSATTYLLLRSPGAWSFDMGMLNEGQLTDYVPGDHYPLITPLGRAKQPGEITFTPAFWNADGKQVDDQEVAFCFDSDIMSMYRLHENGASIGASFDQSARLRGLSLLLHEPAIPDDVAVILQIKRNNQWQDYSFNPVAVGNTTLLAFEPIDMQAFRLNFKFAKDSQRKLLRIYDIGMAR